MAETLTLTPRRVLTPIASLVMAIAFAATLALGFGIRTWTEHTTRAPAQVRVVQVQPAPRQLFTDPPLPLRKNGQPQ